MDGEEGVHERDEPTGGRAHEEARYPGAALVRAVDAPEGAHQHHPLEPDVHDAAALREQAAQRRERERGRPAERRGDQRRPDEDHREARARRLHDEQRRADPDEPADDSAAADAPLPARERPDSRRDRQEPERRGSSDAAFLDRRQGNPHGEQPEGDPDDADRLRRGDAPPGGALEGFGAHAHALVSCCRLRGRAFLARRHA